MTGTASVAATRAIAPVTANRLLRTSLTRIPSLESECDGLTLGLGTATEKGTTLSGFPKQATDFNFLDHAGGQVTSGFHISKVPAGLCFQTQTCRE